MSTFQISPARLPGLHTRHQAENWNYFLGQSLIFFYVKNVFKVQKTLNSRLGLKKVLKKYTNQKF